MAKKQITAKERAKVFGLSLLAMFSGGSLALSFIACVGTEGFNAGGIIVFMISVAVLALALIEASKIQKAINARSCSVQPVAVNVQSGLYCHNCGVQLSPGSKFCSSCGQKISDAPAAVETAATNTSIQRCPRCSSHNIAFHTVTESRKAGFGTILLYVILALTIFGLLIVIPLMLRKKTETVTYAVCQNCGNQWRIK